MYGYIYVNCYHEYRFQLTKGTFCSRKVFGSCRVAALLLLISTGPSSNIERTLGTTRRPLQGFQIFCHYTFMTENFPFNFVLHIHTAFQFAECYFKIFF